MKTFSKLIIFFICLATSAQKSISKQESVLFDEYYSKIKYFINENNEDSIAFYNKKLVPLARKKEVYSNYLDLIVQLSHYYDGKGSFEKSIKISQQGLTIAEFFNDKNFQSEILVDMSHSYRLFHDYNKAIIYGKKALEILPKNESKENLLSKANALNVIAAAHTENSMPDSALVYQKKVLSFLIELDSTEIKNTFVNIGYTFMEIGMLPESKLYTERSLALYKPTKSDYALASIYTNLAMYGRRAKEYKYALQMFDSAIYYTKRSKYIETYVWIYEERAQVYKNLGNFKMVAEDLENLIQIKDSIFKKQRDKNAQETEAIYKTAKKEKEILQQREELLAQKLAIKNQNLYAIIITAALLILGIIFFAIFKRNQLKRKQLQKEIDLKDALAKIKTQNRLQEQRLRISRDLHDNIGSQLTFIISSIDNLKYISKNIDGKLKQKLTNISSFTGDTIHQLRDTIWAMNKSEITVEDLHTRILSFVEKAKTAVPDIDFNISYNMDSKESFTSLAGMNIFRVIQEAINNAIKYAEASEIKINLEEKGTTKEINITDNGKGFDITNVTLGNGLSNMEKRISQIDGKIFINSELNKGTNIKIIL